MHRVEAGVRWLAEGPGTGYGGAAQAYLSVLRDAGVPVSWTPFGWSSEVWPTPPGPLSDLARHGLAHARHADIANRQIDHSVVVVHAPPIWNEQLADEVSGRTVVAYTTWETDRLPPEWVPVLNRYDRILVPSRFNLEALESAGVTAPLYVVPHLVDETPARPVPDEVTSAFAAPVDGFVFSVIGPWTTRKAIADLVTAYLAAFTIDDDVTLLIHTTPDDYIAQARLARGPARRPAPVATWFTLARLLSGRRYPPRIVLSTEGLRDEQMRRLHERADCFVSLSRGEGWGLGGFEAGAVGTPAIVTGWGGSLEYLPDDYPYLVEYDLVPTASDERDAWWNPRPGERWARARIDHAATLMRHVFDHPEQARAWGAALQRHILERFSAPVVTGQLLSALGLSAEHARWR
jgi:glycosyltransferase involved in cell wall biosynthesis